jgi:hypothetical protein
MNNITSSIIELVTEINEVHSNGGITLTENLKYWEKNLS